MNTQNKLKIGIGTVAVLLIAFYTYCLFVYGGAYLSGWEYVVQTGLTVLFSAPVILIAKHLLPKKKGTGLLLIFGISVVGVLVISGITGKALKYNAELLTVAIWPVVCYGIVKYIKVGEKIGFRPFVCDFLACSLITVGLIFLSEEVLFKYASISADVIAEAYMYVISVVAFLLYNIKVRKNTPDAWDIMGLVIIIAAVAALWVCNHERLTSIVESMSYGRTDVDADGDLLNWISHRLAMQKASFSGDFSGINTHRITSVAKGCSLSWLSSAGGGYVMVVSLGLTIIMTALMFFCSARNNNVTVKIITYAFAVKTVVGVLANMFLIFSTSVGVLFIRNIYDILVLALVLFTL